MESSRPSRPRTSPSGGCSVSSGTLRPRPAQGRLAERPAAQTPQRTQRGIFVTLEGPDFSGKSTLARSVRELLTGSKPTTHFTREPGGTPAAELIREVVLDPELEMDAWTEAYLYAAARADLVRRVILPRLEAGENVFYERERRATEMGVPPDRIEAVGAGLMRRVEEGFEELVRLEPGRIEVLDASLPVQDLAGLVVGRLRGLQYTRETDG